MRAALEAPYSSANLHHWIDLIFGCDLILWIDLIFGCNGGVPHIPGVRNFPPDGGDGGMMWCGVESGRGRDVYGGRWA